MNTFMKGFRINCKIVTMNIILLSLCYNCNQIINELCRFKRVPTKRYTDFKTFSPFRVSCRVSKMYEYECISSIGKV